MIETDNCWLKGECNGIDCGGFCLRLFKLDYLYGEALVSMAQRRRITLTTDSDGSDVEAFTKLSSISKDPVGFVSSGGSLYIHSQTAGNGKTSWALRILQSYMNAIWFGSELRCRALFISVPRLLIALKDNISERNEYVQHIKENILTADLVIWDDIATKQSTVFEAENLLAMIDSRIANGKANIYTSNLSDAELHVALGDRLASRVANLSMNIEFRGKDKRGIV